MASKKNDKQDKRKNRKDKHSMPPYLSRDVENKETHKNILVVGEGINTEPSYFEQFHEPGVRVVAIGLGESTRKLVNDVERHREIEEGKLGKKFDEIWVVFDKDSFNDFEQAIKDAEAKGYHVAYTNQSIEYWFILHFKDHQGGCMDRSQYAKVLNDALTEISGDKALSYNPDSKIISDDVFNVMSKKLQTAYDRADKIYQGKCQRGVPTEESVTTIHKLIHSIKGMTSTTEQRKEKERLSSMRKAGLID